MKIKETKVKKKRTGAKSQIFVYKKSGEAEILSYDM